VRRRPRILEIEVRQPPAGADDVERLDEAGRGGGQLARAVQGGEGGLGHAYQAAGRRRGRAGGRRRGRAQPLQGEPEQDRVELHELRERPPGSFAGEDFGHQVHAEPGHAVRLVGGERKPGDPRAGEDGERLARGAARLQTRGLATRGRRRPGPDVRRYPGRDGRRRGPPLGEVGQYGEIEGPLAGEVGVDGAAGEPGALGDGVDLGGPEAVFGELVPGRGQHLDTGALLRLRPREPAHRPPRSAFAGRPEPRYRYHSNGPIICEGTYPSGAHR
jgi:hypothetical protein